MLLDEPLSNLDAKLRLKLRGELKKLQRQLGITMVYVTHDQEEAMSLADHMAVMRDGVVEQIGTPAELYRRPGTLFTAVFLGRTSLVLGKVEEEKEDTVRVRVGETSFEAVNHGLRYGDEAAIVVKADGARLAPPKTRHTVIEGTVSVVMYLGGFIELRLSPPGVSHEIMLDLPPDASPPPPGEKARVYVPLENVHAFPVEEKIVKEAMEQA